MASSVIWLRPNSLSASASQSQSFRHVDTLVRREKILVTSRPWSLGQGFCFAEKGKNCIVRVGGKDTYSHNVQAADSHTNHTWTFSTQEIRIEKSAMGLQGEELHLDYHVLESTC